MAGGRQTLHSERFCGRSNGRIKPIVPDAASVMSGGFAQRAEFAKSQPFPDSGPSRSLRRMPVESPLYRMLRIVQMSVSRVAAKSMQGFAKGL